MQTQLHPTARLQPLMRDLCGGLGTALLLLLVATAAPEAHAAPVTYTFTGVVDDDEAARGFSGFSGSFTFDSTASDSIVDISTAAFAHSGAPWGLTLAFDGGAAFTLSDSFNVLVSNDLLGMDQWGLLAQDALQSISLSFTDFAGLVFGSDALPLPNGGLTLAAFSASTLRWESGSGALQGHMATLACSSGCTGAGGGGGGGGEQPPANSVPEPPTLLLAALSLGLMLRRSLKRAP